MIGAGCRCRTVDSRPSHEAIHDTGLARARRLPFGANGSVYQRAPALRAAAATCFAIAGAPAT